MDELLCWCCAVWGLTRKAIDGSKRLCMTCLNTVPAKCGEMHLAQALAAGRKAGDG